MTTKVTDRTLALRYLSAKRWVIQEGYGNEVDWQAGLDFERVTERNLIEEAAWVILNSGMREKVVRSVWPGVSIAFLGWHSADEIVKNRAECIENARLHFRHDRKVRAIVTFCEFVALRGHDSIKKFLRDEPDEAVRSLPFIGPRTYYHLAKNLGLPVAKPDRHLERIATAHQHTGPMSLCQSIATTTGDTIGVVDIVLWRACALGCDYHTLEPKGSVQ